jgi:hypothetical protein
MKCSMCNCPVEETDFECPNCEVPYVLMHPEKKEFIRKLGKYLNRSKVLRPHEVKQFDDAMGFDMVNSKHQSDSFDQLFELFERKGRADSEEEEEMLEQEISRLVEEGARPVHDRDEEELVDWI